MGKYQLDPEFSTTLSACSPLDSKHDSQIHFVPVSWHDLEEDLPRKVRWAIDHDKEAEQIMLNGRQWVLDNLVDTNVGWFQQQVSLTGIWHAPLRHHSPLCLKSEPKQTVLCVLQALLKMASLQAEDFPLIPGAVKFCCNHLAEADRPHYLQKCLEYAPQHMIDCGPSLPNAFNLARYGSFEASERK